MPDSQAKASTLELIDGLPFGLAAIMLFHGVTLLIEGSNVDRAVVWAARIMTVVIRAYYCLFLHRQRGSRHNSSPPFESPGRLLVGSCEWHYSQPGATRSPHFFNNLKTATCGLVANCS